VSVLLRAVSETVDEVVPVPLLTLAVVEVGVELTVAVVPPLEGVDELAVLEAVPVGDT
jgi:hypothetical protein